MKKTLANIIMGVVLMGSAVMIRAEDIEKTLYVNKQWYKTFSNFQVQVEMKSAEFDRKFPNKLAEYNETLQKLQIYDSVAKDRLTADQKKEIASLITIKKDIEDLIGDDYKRTLQEIVELNTQSEVLYAQTLKSILSKINGSKPKVDGIKNWSPTWYYLSPRLDITDLLMDEINNRPWARNVNVDFSKVNRIYYVDQNQVLQKFTSTSMTASDYMKYFYEGCKNAAQKVGAEMIVELNQSGYEALRPDFDITEDVSMELLKLSAKR